MTCISCKESVLDNFEPKHRPSCCSCKYTIHQSCYKEILEKHSADYYCPECSAKRTINIIKLEPEEEQEIQYVEDLPFPHAGTLINASKFSIEQDKPILMDYYIPTYNGSAFLGIDQTTNEKLLVKSAEEYTSNIQKIFKTYGDYIVITENSIYLVHSNIKKRSIK